jgi:hypothetical protein
MFDFDLVQLIYFLFYIDNYHFVTRHQMIILNSFFLLFKIYLFVPWNELLILLFEMERNFRRNESVTPLKFDDLNEV